MNGLAPGALIAQRYRLSAPLGAGSQGQVWEAVDTRRDGALRAIKFSNDGVQQRGEVEALLRLDHPALPRVFDFGVHDGGSFVVLERVAGIPLHPGVDTRVAIRALADVAGGLAALHAAGLIHGDVKPANILVGAERAWLVDLGLASRRGVAATSGTLAFMPPEALAGERGDSSDLYALGVTAAMVLTGRHPLVDDPKDRAALLAAIARHAPPRAGVVAELPSIVREAVSALLAPEPERRARSATAWLARLARDAAPELTAAQRAAALSLPVERIGRLPLVGRDRSRDQASASLTRALDGEGIGVVVVGPPGAGRRRLCEDALRAVMIAAAARGALPEVCDDLPLEPLRATVVRLFDATAAEIAAAAHAIERMARFSEGAVPVALLATGTEAPADTTLACVTLGPLERSQVAELLGLAAGRAVDDAALEAWLEATGALAGRVGALAARVDVSAIATATPAELARIRLDAAAALPADLSPDAREAALLLAAAGEPLVEADLSGALGVASAAAPVAELCRRGIAIVRDDRLQLTTPVALEGLVAAERARVGEALEAHFARTDPARSSVRARAAMIRDDRAAALHHARSAAHTSTGGPLARVGWLEMARGLADGDERIALALRLAAELLVLAEPARALEVLQELPGTPEVLAARADALRRAGKASEARALANALLGAADAGADAVARIVLARDALDRNEPRAAREVLGVLADGEVPSAGLRARALEVGALAALYAGDREGTTARVERAERVAQVTGDTVQRARLRSLAGIAAQQRGDHDAGMAAYRDAWSLASAAGDAHGAATYAVNLGAAELECGALGEALHWLSRGTRSLARLGRMGDLGRALVNLASLHAFVGDRAGAAEHAGRAEDAARVAGDRVTQAMAQMIGAEASLQGAAAAEALAGAAHALALAGDAGLAAEARARAAQAWAQAGDAPAARAALVDAADAPAALLAIASLEVALCSNAGADALREGVAAARAALAVGRTLEFELEVLALAVRAADTVRDVSEGRRARAAYSARVEALAATLPEGLAAVFSDRRAVADAPSPTVPTVTVSARATATDARWRRLAEVTRELNSEHRLHALLERVMDAIVELTGAARGFLLLKGADGQLRIRTARNIGRRDLRGEEMAFSRSVAERVARDREPLLTVDASSDGRLDAFESVHAMRLRSILAVPLTVQGDVVGTVYVDDRFRAAAFGEDALEIAREFAETAALAIHNARTQARLRRALADAERLSSELKARVDAQTVELEATRRALSAGGGARGRYEQIVGRGPAMQRTLTLLDKVAPTAMPVLLQGESGTGKELIARALHANSPRAARPFVAENCGAIPETLLESVLFGHVKGAFTGADRPRAGLFEVADGGSLFLDEIGEMSPAMQAKLLRVLQDGEVRPLGGERVRKVDVRVIAATHRDLLEMVKQGRFREDLYYRLAVMVVPVPALRNRREDIPALVGHFIEKHARKDVGVDRKAMARLVGFAWPGNVRQLENELMRACVLAEGVIRDEDLSPALNAPTEAAASEKNDPLNLRQAVDELERRLVERALKEHGGNQSRAAKVLGLSRFGLQKKLKRLRLSPQGVPLSALESDVESAGDEETDEDADVGVADEGAALRLVK